MVYRKGKCPWEGKARDHLNQSRQDAPIPVKSEAKEGKTQMLRGKADLFVIFNTIY